MIARAKAQRGKGAKKEFNFNFAPLGEKNF
jgi:hypothetical protein